MERLVRRGYRPKVRPSGHNITAKFVDKAGSIPGNVLTLGNNDANSRYFTRLQRGGVGAPSGTVSPTASCILYPVPDRRRRSGRGSLRRSCTTGEWRRILVGAGSVSTAKLNICEAESSDSRNPGAKIVVEPFLERMNQFRDTARCQEGTRRRSRSIPTSHAPGERCRWHLVLRAVDRWDDHRKGRHRDHGDGVRSSSGVVVAGQWAT